MRRQGADEAFARARDVMRAVRLIGAVTPTNADAELARLDHVFSRGNTTTPAWTYARHDVRELEQALIVLDRAAHAWDEPLRSLYSARIAEIALEVAMAGAAGTNAFAELAARRFAFRSESDADDLATAWTADEARHRAGAGHETVQIPTDSLDPRSLLSRVRAEISAQRAPFVVKVAKNLGALAATGERTVYVAEGPRTTTERGARRIAIHEVHGHVLPRVHAEHAHPMFALGAARGADDQEGLALFYEDRASLLDDDRKRELGRRHRAATLMRSGADFVSVARALVAMGATWREAVAISSRVFRGSHGKTAGLGRESVYIASFLRVRACVANDPRAARTLASGQVSVDALARLATLHCAGKHASADPPPITVTV